MLRIAMAILLAALCIGPIIALVRRRGVSMARAIAAHGHCATCGYLLVDLPAAPDGCTVCPECGSAWKITAPQSADDH